MRALALVLVAAAAGCSYTFDDTAPSLPLVGDPPGTYSLPKLNESPCRSRVLVTRGLNEEYWGVWRENAVNPEGRTVEAVRFVKLHDPALRELYFVDEYRFGYRDVYLFKYGNPNVADDPTRITLRLPGAPSESTLTFELPPGKGVFGYGGRDAAFYWWPKGADVTEFVVQRKDRTFSRRIPLPPGADPLGPPGRVLLWFNGDGDYLFTRDGDGVVVRHATRSEEDLTIGPTGRVVAIDNGRGNFITCDEHGLTQVYYDGERTNVLDPTPCLAFQMFVGQKIYYATAEGLSRVALSGAEPPERIELPGRPLAFISEDELVYSLDPADKYIESAGDGWVRGWRFMERGIDVRISRDRKKLRWLENAAKQAAIGDLRSAPLPTEEVPTPEPLNLARNVWTWEELEDGRVLVIENRALRGDFNRLVVVDEKAGTRRWVAEGASNYLKLSPTEAIIERWGSIGHDAVLVPIPPSAASPEE